MARGKSDDPLDDLPSIGQPARQALHLAGITRLDQLPGRTAAELLKLHGVGPKAIGILRAALEARGQAFAGEAQTAKAVEPLQDVLDSPKGWVRSHIQEYVASDGKKGHQWRGWPALLLTTVGRKSGKRRRTALIYGREGNNYLLVASNGGARSHPLWYLNLVANPEVELQVGAEKLVGRARAATASEKPRLWKLMTKIYPAYDQYQAKTGREIPLVVVEPVGKR